MQALVSEGDRVLCPDPGFVSYNALATLAGGRPVSVPLTRDLHVDAEKAKDLMDGARLLVLNSPGNPTGAVESKESIRALVEYAADKGVTVVSDEVYEHFIYGREHWSAGRFGDNVVTVNATSKTYAMTGWRLGYLAAPDEIVSQCIKVHQVPARPAPRRSRNMPQLLPTKETSTWSRLCAMNTWHAGTSSGGGSQAWGWNSPFPKVPFMLLFP